MIRTAVITSFVAIAVCAAIGAAAFFAGRSYERGPWESKQAELKKQVAAVKADHAELGGTLLKLGEINTQAEASRRLANDDVRRVSTERDELEAQLRSVSTELAEARRLLEFHTPTLGPMVTRLLDEFHQTDNEIFAKAPSLEKFTLPPIEDYSSIELNAPASDRDPEHGYYRAILKLMESTNDLSLRVLLERKSKQIPTK